MAKQKTEVREGLRCRIFLPHQGKAEIEFEGLWTKQKLDVAYRSMIRDLRRFKQEMAKQGLYRKEEVSDARTSESE